MEILIGLVLGVLLMLSALAWTARSTTKKMDKLIAGRDEVPIKFLDGCVSPQYMTEHSAAVDLVAQECTTIQPGKRAVIATGLSGAIPKGHAGLVCSRSGIALKYGVVVANAPGVIDPDYRGEWKVILANLSDWPFKVKAGNRIAQLMIIPVRRCQFVEVDKLEKTDRKGGFGSTGI